MKTNRQRTLRTTTIAASLLLAPALSHGFAYTFAEQTGINNLVTHSMGYTGTGGIVDISFGILDTSPHANNMEVSVLNSLYRWNQLDYTTGNLFTGTIPGSQADFESVLMHEMGHALGLDHPNLASESGLSGSDRRYSAATTGSGTYDLDPGSDGVIGTADDQRGDDENLFWYQSATNDPFAPLPATVDSTTYSRNVGGTGEPDWVNTSTREAAGALGYSNTESIMSQGAYYGEVQRELTADDVAGIMYAMTGIDEIAGTADDYILNLTYSGLVASGGVVDILISMDSSTSFGATHLATSVNSTVEHAFVTAGDMTFNQNTNWFFNQQLIDAAPPTGAAPLPSTFLLLVPGLLFFARRRPDNA